MKKKALIILIFGVALIVLGVIYEFSNNRGTNKELKLEKETDTIINDENNMEEEPKIDDNSLNETVNFSGKYSNDFGELFIYHDNFFKYDMYFIVNNDTYGKASINDNIASGTKNNKTYQFVFNGSTLTVESNDPNVSGTYQKVNDLMREEYFNLRYGDYDYLISQYNRCYTSEKMDIKMYRATKDKVYVFIDSLDGKKVFINANCTFQPAGGVEFGDDIFVGSDVKFYTTIHPIDPEERAAGKAFVRPIKINSKVWIGGNVTILPGVEIGEGTTIGAGAVVTRSIPPRCVAVGNPCKVLRYLDEKKNNDLKENK